MCNANSKNTLDKNGNTGNKPRGPTHMRPRVAPNGFEHSEETRGNCVKWEGWAVDAKQHDDSFREAQKYEDDQKKREERFAAFAKTTVEVDTNRQHFRQTVVNPVSKVEGKVESEAENKVENKVDTKKPGFVPPHLRKKLAAAVTPAENKTE